jgi:tetratricopeptide (TPR) repeat protein
VLAFFVLADTVQSDEHWTQAAGIANELDLPEEAALLDQLRAGVAWDRGDIQTAIATNERLLAFHEERGNRFAVAGTLHLLGEHRRDLGEYEPAELQLRAADAIYRELGDDIGLVNNSHSIADLALDRGSYAEAIEIYRTTLTEYAGDDSRIDAYCLAGIASALAATGHDTDAAALWGAVCNAEQTLGFRMLSSERKRYETHLTRLEGSDGWTQGRTLTLMQAAEKLDAIAAAEPDQP